MLDRVEDGDVEIKDPKEIEIGDLVAGRSNTVKSSINAEGKVGASVYGTSIADQNFMKKYNEDLAIEKEREEKMQKVSLIFSLFLC